MKKNLKWWLGSVVASLMLAGCAATAHVEKDDNVDFSHYKTFAWVDKDGQKGDRNKTNDLMENKIREAVSKELEKSSDWRESKNRPDVLLTYDVLVERNIKETNNPVYSRSYTRLVYNPYTRRYSTIYYPSEFMGYDRDQYPVREGTVTISMIDAKTDRTVWQGWTTDEIDGRHLSNKEIQSAVKSIFKKFDVAKN
jgi:hypothetical protein